MTPIPDEMLMAYADGELTPEESKALEGLLSRDPVLRTRLAPFAETRAQLAAVFGPTLHEPVPDRLVAVIARAASPQRDNRRKPAVAQRIHDVLEAARLALFPAGFNMAMAASVAALLTVGAATGWLAGRSAQPGMIEAAGPGLVATGALAHALETSPSGSASSPDGSGASIVPVLSFRSAHNGICREYRIAETDAASGFAGLACRAPDGIWRVALHVETAKQPPSGGYQTATASNVPAVDAFVESMISGDALGKEDETALMKTGWK